MKKTTAAIHLPGPSELAALRAWYEGISSVDAVKQYLKREKTQPNDEPTARAVIGRIRRCLIEFAKARHREDLTPILTHGESIKARTKRAQVVASAIEVLRSSPLPSPQITDEVDRWLSKRCVRVLKTHGINTLADLTVHVPRRKRWWASIKGLGFESAKQIEVFFAAHPLLVKDAWELVSKRPIETIVPWGRIELPNELDGSVGAFRAPLKGCTLNASNDYEAIHTWLSLHESPATQRAYKREAERLILWAIVERHKPLSSLNTEDAIAYRSFLRAPTPSRRWVGPSVARSSPDWKPFAGGLSSRSTSYALTVIASMFRWLMAQGYMLVNPFAGVKNKSSSQTEKINVERIFSEGEWSIIRTEAQALEWTHGWDSRAAQRLRFMLDFGYATGLRLSELVGAKLGHIEIDARGEHWIKIKGKGNKHGKVALPPLARSALDQMLMQRGLPLTPSSWKPSIHLIYELDAPLATSGITASRAWIVMRRFFVTTANALEKQMPSTAEKLRQASPHWLRHTHATHALARGAELTTVRDNLRHASVSTTSVYLHSDEVKRSRQMSDAFGMG